MDSSTPLILLSSMVLVFYVLDMLASRWRIPSVLFLIGIGIATRQLSDWSSIQLPDPAPFLPALGLLGLGLIVLEGALELRFRPGHGRLAAQAGASAILGIAFFAIPVGVAIHQIEGCGWRQALLNAMPLAVISSAIAIPSAARLPVERREFVAFESSLSDILGVLAFNALLVPHALGLSTLLGMGANALVTLLLSLVVCFGLIVLLARTPHKVRFFPLLAGLILTYALGKHYHLSSLLLLLCFGLAFANLHLLPEGFARRLLVHPRLEDDTHLLDTLVRETTFLVRTLFFFAFGMSLAVGDILDPLAWGVGGALLAAIYATRSLALLSSTGAVRRDLLFIAPRGLVSVLLFGGIAAADRSSLVGSGALLVVVLGSSTLQILAGREVAESSGVVPPSLAGHFGPYRDEPRKEDSA